MFKPGDYNGTVQELGEKIAKNLEIEFVGCKWCGKYLAFEGSFRYKEVETKIVLAGRKEIEVNKSSSKLGTKAEAKLLSWKRGLDNG